MKSSRVAPFWKALALSWVLLAFLSIAWSITTPIAAAPDEPAHLVKAASVARGEFIGPNGTHGQDVHVPAYIAYTHSQTCFAFKPEVTADCIPQYPGNPSEIVIAPTTAGLYNPVYYLVVGWPSLILQDESGIFAIRIVSALVSSLFLALGFATICTWRKPLVPLIGAVVAVTPMVLFLNGTVNPNSLEIATTFAAFVAVLGIVRQSDNANLTRSSAIVFIAAALAANARGLSPLWLAVALLTPFLLASKERIIELLRQRAVQLTMIGVVIAVIAATAWLLGSNSLGAGLGDPDAKDTIVGVGTSPLLGFMWTLLETFRYALGIVGVFGWLDTTSPEFVYFVWSVLAGGIVLLALLLMRGKRLAFVLAIMAAVVLLPPLVQGLYITGGGVVWQGRYILPLFVCAMVGLTALLSNRLSMTRTTASRLLMIVLALVGLAQFVAFVSALRRYSVGVSGAWKSMLHSTWSPAGGIPLWIALFALALAIGAAVIFVFARRHPELLDEKPLAVLVDAPVEKPNTAHKKSGGRPDEERELNSGDQVKR